MKLEVWPSDLVFRVESKDRQGGQGFLNIRYASWCKSIFKMVIKHMDELLNILMPRVRTMGMQEQKIRVHTA